MLVMAIAMFVKVVVPAGYMFSTGERVLTVQICADGLSHQIVQIAIPVDEKSQSGNDKHSGKTGNSPCAFTSLTMGSLAAVDLSLLAIALAFILLLGFAPVQAAPRAFNPHLRPPLRGPPALI